MCRGRLHARLDKLMPPPGLGRIVVLFPENWPAKAQVAYDAASLAGDSPRPWRCGRSWQSSLPTW